MIIDTHCHYNLDPLFRSWQQHRDICLASGVIGAVVPGVDEQSSRRGAELAATSPYFQYALGIHPTTAGERTTPTTLNELEQLWNDLSPVALPIAIGETGLDFYHLPVGEKLRREYMARQRESFQAHIELATQYGLPLIVHVRDTIEASTLPDSAYWQTLDILKQYDSLTAVVLHCASGPTEYVVAAVELGAYVSFAGNVTYPSASHIRDLVKIVPADKILVETDAPYLPPQSHRGQVCEPAYIMETVDQLTELGISSQQLIRNATQFFQHQFGKATD